MYNDAFEVLQDRASKRTNRQNKRALRASNRAAHQLNRNGRHIQAAPQAPVMAPGVPPNVIMPGTAACAGTCFPNVGWLAPAITFLANNRRFAMSMSEDNAVVLPSSQPMILAAGTPAELARQCALAVQGQGVKTSATVVVASPVVDVTLSLAGTTTFGALVRITNSYLNFKFGRYEIQLLNNGVVQSIIQVKIMRVPADFLILSINNNNGLASVVPNAVTQVKFVAANNPCLVPASDVVDAESLNMKDLGDIVIS